MSVDDGLLAKVARQIASGVEPGGSILAVSAASYGVMSDEDVDETTQPTGFDPQAVALFEAVVESAYLVANADGAFDDEERETFQRVVHAACSDSVEPGQLESLVADFDEMLQEDGIDQRINMIAKTIQKPEQSREVLRIAGLIAHVSGGVSDVERGVLGKLATAFGLDGGALDVTLGEVKQALQS